MSSRYIRQFEFTNSVHLPACPVTLEKGAVLLDNKTNTYQLQLKLSNIGDSSLKETVVYIEALTDAGDLAYPALRNEYHGLAEIGTAFGTKQLLPLPNNNATGFRVYVEKIVDRNGKATTYQHEQYIRDANPNDVAAERETVLATHVAKQEKQQKLQQADWDKWNAGWYHAVFALCALLSLFRPVRNLLAIFHFPSLLQILITIGLWFFAWKGMGSSKLLVRSAIAAIGVPITAVLCLVLHLRSYYIRAGDVVTKALFTEFTRTAAFSFIPLLLIFLNVKRLEGTLNPDALLSLINPKRDKDNAPGRALPNSQDDFRREDDLLAQGKAPRIVFALLNALLLYIVPWMTFSVIRNRWIINKLGLSVCLASSLLVLIVGIIPKRRITLREGALLLGYDLAWIVIMLGFVVKKMYKHRLFGFIIAAVYLVNILFILSRTSGSGSRDHSVKTVLCPSCGTAIEEKARFCHKCGVSTNQS